MGGVIGVGGGPPRLTIYQLEEIPPHSALASAVDQLHGVANVEQRKAEAFAYVGELAGPAVDLLLRQDVQALATAMEIGGGLWAVVRAAKKLGKKAAASKKLIGWMGLHQAKDDIPSDPERWEAQVRVWGPMAVADEEGLPGPCLEPWDKATSPVACFMAVAVAQPRKRVRTSWMLLGADGLVCASWRTQTLAERVPEHMRPTTILD